MRKAWHMADWPWFTTPGARRECQPGLVLLSLTLSHSVSASHQPRRANSHRRYVLSLFLSLICLSPSLNVSVSLSFSFSVMTNAICTPALRKYPTLSYKDLSVKAFTAAHDIQGGNSCPVLTATLVPLVWLQVAFSLSYCFRCPGVSLGTNLFSGMLFVLSLSSSLWAFYFMPCRLYFLYGTLYLIFWFRRILWTISWDYPEYGREASLLKHLDVFLFTSSSEPWGANKVSQNPSVAAETPQLYGGAAASWSRVPLPAWSFTSVESTVWHSKSLGNGRDHHESALVIRKNWMWFLL